MTGTVSTVNTASTAGPSTREVQATELGGSILERPVSRFGALRVITPLGWGVLAAVALLTPLGLIGRWWEWWALAVGGAVVVVLAVLSALGRFAYHLQLRVSDRRLVVGEPGRVGVRVRNTSRRRLLPATVEVDLAGRVYAAAVGSLPVNGYDDVILPVPTSRRTVLTVGPVRAIRGDALGLIRRVVTWQLAEKVYVQPRTVRTDGALAGYVRDLEGEESSIRTASDLSFHTLREYVPGDDRRHVHWKSTARTGTLLVREFLQTHRSLVLVALSTAPADYSDEEEFELAVSCAASVVSGLLRMDRTVVTVAGRDIIRGTNPGAVLDRYCSITSDENAELPAVVRAAARAEPYASLLIPVFGAAPPARAVQATYRLRPAGAQVLGLRARTLGSTHPIGGPSARTLTVPDLAALPALLRQART